MPEYNSTKILKVSAVIECEGLPLRGIHEIGFDHNIRLRWKVTNISDEQVWILGYYAPLIHEGDNLGIYDSRSSHFLKRRAYISNDHVRVLLYPDESRSYIWAWQSPWDYGMSREGEWKYRVQMSYSIGGKKEESKHAQARVKLREKARGSIKKQRKLRSIIREGQILDLLKEHVYGLSPLLDLETSRKFKAGRIGYIDFIARTSSGPVVIEVKRLIDRKAVQAIISYLQWSYDVLGPRFGTEVQGVLVGMDFTSEAIEGVNYSKFPILLLKYSENKLMRVMA